MRLEKRSVFGWGASAAGYGPCKNGLVAHYDGSNQGLAGKQHDSCRAYWKNTRRFHMGAARGWADIGYSYAVCPHGYVLEGRGWQKQQAAQPGGNSTWTSVTFMSGPTEKPTTAQINAFRELRAYLRGKGLAAAISYHGKFISTSCPGSILKGMVTSGALAGSPTTTDWMEAMVNKLPTLGKGDKGEHVQSLQALLQARSHPEVKQTGTFDAATEKALKAVQEWGGVTSDGVCGPKSWPVVLRVHE
jgi:hypothetical protein